MQFFVFIISLVIGAFIFTFSAVNIRKKDICSITQAENTLREIFSKAKSVALLYGKSQILFDEEKNEVVIYSIEVEGEATGSGQNQILNEKRRVKIPFKLSVPDTDRKACGNERGTPKQEKSFTFSNYGLSDISGAVYFKCDREYIAVSVIAPLGAVRICKLKDGKWEILR